MWRLRFSGVALWLPPHVDLDGDAIVAVLTGTVAPAKHEDTFAVLGQMDDAHPKDPHWYLPWFGVDPIVQGRGLGGELMKHCLRVIDEDHLPAYLDSPNPRNISFYQRYGFVVTGEAQLGPARYLHAQGCAIEDEGPSEPDAESFNRGDPRAAP